VCVCVQARLRVCVCVLGGGYELVHARVCVYVLLHVHIARCLPRYVCVCALLQAGEQTVWERMPAIECNCTLEATLDKCVAKVQNQVSVCTHI